MTRKPPHVAYMAISASVTIAQKTTPIEAETSRCSAVMRRRRSKLDRALGLRESTGKRTDLLNENATSLTCWVRKETRLLKKADQGTGISTTRVQPCMYENRMKINICTGIHAYRAVQALTPHNSKKGTTKVFLLSSARSIDCSAVKKHYLKMKKVAKPQSGLPILW